MSARERKETDRERPNSGTPEASNPALADFLEQLWDGESPQKIELVPLGGQSLTKADKPIDRVDYKANPPKPSKEKIVELSNRFVAAAQRDCDVAGKPRRYGVIAIDERRGSDPVGRFPLKMEPKNVNSLDEEEQGDGLGSDRLLRRVRDVFEDDRWRQVQFAQSIEGIMAHYKGMVERLQSVNDQLMQRNFDLYKLREESLSQQHARDMDLKKQEFWLTQVRDGATLFKGLLPHAVSKITGKQLPTEKSLEQLQIQTFIQGCSPKQLEDAFGLIDGERKKENCIFTLEQTLIFDGVARGELHPDKLYDLFAGGAHEITMAQIGLAQQVFSQDQLMPIFLLMKDMMAKKTGTA